MVIVVRRFAFAFFLLAQPASNLAADEDQEASALRDYHSGNGLLNRSLYDLAAAEYEKFLDAHPDHAKAPIARYGLGVSLYRTAKYEEASRQLSSLTDLKEFQFAAEAATLLGQSFFALKRYEQAAVPLETVRDRYAKHELADDAAALVIEARYHLGEYLQTRKAARRFVKRWPDSPLGDRVAFFAGLSLMKEQKPEHAVEQFTLILERFGNSPLADQAALLLARCYHLGQQYAQAQQWYRKVLSRPSEDYHPDALYNLGLSKQQQGHPGEAASHYRQLLDRFGASDLAASARLHLSQCLYDQGDVKQATKVLQKVAPDDREVGDQAAYLLAKCRIKQQRFTEAARVLERAMKKFPKSDLLPQMNYDLAVAHLKANHRAEAMAALQTLRQRFKDHDLAAEALHLQAVAEHQAGRYEESVRDGRAFLKQYPDHESAKDISFLVGESLYLAGQYDHAAIAFRSFLKRFPNDAQAPRAKYRLGMALYQKDQFEEAEAVLVGVAHAGPQAAEFSLSHLALGEIYFQSSQWTKSQRHFEDYLRSGLDVDAADAALLKLGLSHFRLQNATQALKQFKRLLEHFDSSPHRVQAIFEIGQAHLSQNQPERAREAFQQVVSADDHSQFSAHAHNHLAVLALAQKQYDRAADHFGQSARLATGTDLAEQARFQRAQALMAAERFEQAVQAFEEFLAAHGDHRRAAQARSQLIVALGRLDRHSETLQQFETLQRSGSGAIDGSTLATVQYEKAWAHRKLGQLDKAEQTYRQLLTEAAEGNVKAHALLELAELEANRKNYQEAATLMEQLARMIARDSSEIPPTLAEQASYRLAVYHFELQRFEQAATTFERFIKQFSHSALLAAASFFCAEANMEIGRYRKAVGHFQRVATEFPSDALCGPSLLRLGECLGVLQKWARAEQTFQLYLERFSDNELWFQAQFGIAWARENQGRFNEAIRSYKTVLSRHQGETAARAQFQIGQCLFAQKHYEQAATELLKVDILYGYPEWSAAALFEAGRCFEQLDQSGRAQQQFKQVVEKYAQTKWAELAKEKLVARGS